MKLYLKRYQTSTANHTAEFQNVLTQSATEAGCNATCVADCAATMTGYANQSTCLDVCVCFYDSTVRVPPAPVANTTNATVEAVPTLVTAVATTLLNQTATQATGFTQFIPKAVQEIIATNLNVTQPVEQTVTVTETTPSTTTTTTVETTTTTTTTTATPTESTTTATLTVPLVDVPLVTVEAPVVSTTPKVEAPLTVTVGSTPVTVETTPLTATIAVSEPTVTLDTTVLDANATTALFGEAVQTQGNNTATYMGVLVLVFFFMVMTALYVNQDLKKKNKEDNEQYDTLNDYLLLKA